MELDEVRGSLVQEARELLAGMESALLVIEQDGATPDAINAIFRAAHTIKGSAGLFALDLVVSFTHALESVLDRVRNGRLSIDDSMLSLLLACGDYIAKLIDCIETGHEHTDPDAQTRSVLLAQLSAYLEVVEERPDVIVAPEQVAVEAEMDRGAPVANRYWHISLRIAQDALRNGMDPLSFIRYLSTLGEVAHIHTLTEDLPQWEEMDPEACYFGFEIDFDSPADQKTIEDVFEFVRDGSRISVLPPHCPIGDYAALVHGLPEAPELIGMLLVDGGALTTSELEQVLAWEEQQRAPAQALAQVEATALAASAPETQGKPKAAEEQRKAPEKFIKVEASKLDQLINLVGELVIASAGARLIARQLKSGPMEESVASVVQFVEQIRDASLNLRMVPIGEVFQRFPRVVRDICKDLGKEIELKISGADAELDKSMVEKLSDPLMHIVRNAADHGIEPVEVRRAQGKPDFGTMRLHAYHESGSIVIEVSDDGRGLNREKIRAKAIERGLIHADQVLTDAETYKLIFEPGFSTAEQVTNLSGRGVGMDVVKKNIEQLRGEVEIESQPGLGATVRIRLPLTLAIIDGFQVMVGNTTFVIPLEMVVECVDLTVQDTVHNIVNLRSHPLPFVRLADMFEIGGQRGSRENSVRESLVVVQYGQSSAGLVVDRLIGEFQAVIKPLGQLLRGVRNISGSTILGDGRVALILDVPSLVHQAASLARKNHEEEARTAIPNSTTAR
jgi:two-component system chemotaxis sensor kinase CheA